MLESERHRLIKALVAERSVVAVGDLVSLIGASEATIRRDIAALAQRGEVRRVRGGAEALHPRHQPHLVGMPFAMKRDMAASEKRAIAEQACALIEDGASIAINGGTTTFAMAEFLVERELDILTNSFPLAMELYQRGKSRIHLPAGELFPEQNIILSPFTQDGTAHFRADLMFTSCYGIGRQGLMETDPLIVQGQSRLLERAERVVVMVDSPKLSRRSSTLVAPLERVAVVITDSGATEAQLEPLRAAGLEVLIVQPAEASLQEAG